jgi:hypothetical protein
MVRLIKEFNELPRRSRRMRRMNEETEWSQVDQTARQVVRRALRNNGIGVVEEFDDEELSTGGDFAGNDYTDISIKRVFVTDLPADSREKPFELKDALDEIKSRLSRDDYVVMAFPSRERDWTISVSKI